MPACRRLTPLHARCMLSRHICRWRAACCTLLKEIEILGAVVAEFERHARDRAPPPIRARPTVTTKRGLDPTYPVRTARLDLRPHRPDDLKDLFAFHSHPEVVRYVPWPVRDREQTRIALEAKLAQGVVTEPGQWLVLAMEIRRTSTVIGEVLLKWESETSRQGEIGFAVHKAYQGHGFASEAARAVLRLGFDDLGLHRIVAVCIDANVDSVRLLRRLGMRQEAHLRDNVFFKGEWADQLVFGLLEAEWRRHDQVAPRNRDCFERNYQRRRRNSHGRQS
jgi:RimJ/RimL family protein N-acetyltransferase